ncbi:MAG TPA: hypothetical protein VG370_32450 [Chloroflexota bacterium]|jgi:hypothetical protein|nr:hypothetical protein [Chloroflexota bacterium]
MGNAGRALQVLLRRVEHGYLVEGPAGVVRRRYPTLVGALNADPTLRQRWRPARPEELAEWGLGSDVLYVVTA